MTGPRGIAYLSFVWVALLLIQFSFSTCDALEFVLLSAPENKLYSVKTPLSDPSLIGTVNAGTDLYELVEASPDRLYTFDRAGNTLIEVSRSNAQVLATTPLDQDVFSTRRGFDLSPSGVLYGVLPGMQLRTIDPITGATTFIANITGAPRVEAIAFTPDGVLYAVGSADDNATSESLYRLSVTTGELTLIGLMAVTDVDALTFAPDGFLYGVDAATRVMAHLLKIDPITAAVEDLGSTGVVGANGIVAIRRPKIDIAKSGGAIVISWPTNAVGFNLQSKDSLDVLASWARVGTEPTFVDGKNVFTNSSNSERLFFRLIWSMP